eukprot:scaffold1869_cov163-Ochromonas_danica.AAC.10
MRHVHERAGSREDSGRDLRSRNSPRLRHFHCRVPPRPMEPVSNNRSYNRKIAAEQLLVPHLPWEDIHEFHANRSRRKFFLRGKGQG